MQFENVRNENELLCWVDSFLGCDKDDVANVSRNQKSRQQVVTAANELVYQAYIDNNRRALSSLHDVLQKIHEIEFSSGSIDSVDCERRPILTDISSILEAGMFSREKIFIEKQEVGDYPKTGDEFTPWFKKLINEHKAASHEFYDNYLLNEASTEDVRYLLAQETSLDPRFDDILALIQLGTSGQEKMEIASNYWDEMGNGEPEMVHTRLFSLALDSIEADPNYIKDNISLEAKICGNLSGGLALSRRHYYKAIGYFGVTEYLAPRRFISLVKAWNRLGLPSHGIEYHKLHVKIDAIHGNAWLKNVIQPLVDRDPNSGKEIINGALMRLNTSNDYLNALADFCRKRNDISEKRLSHAS